MENLNQLDLSSNELTGSVLNDFSELKSLSSALNLSYNHFSGKIPKSLGDLPLTDSDSGNPEKAKRGKGEGDLVAIDKPGRAVEGVGVRAGEERTGDRVQSGAREWNPGGGKEVGGGRGSEV
ncbi:uncharacterized protein LOC125476863 [Pyrus x bretschneideri]|uniref:uncharacterized protein LOC125476863 n=1 Tax=Pyrus x bretschneideri TaxID=225117 RepID=UPI00202FC575|nr:uncharacterized protein LOC125476863 [Pyrus x bretschneideri]